MLPEEIVQQIKYVANYVGTETTDWFAIKKEILGGLRPKTRSFFSRRHKTSKKHFINNNELEIMGFWKELTGTTLVVDEARLHKKEDERPPRSWALMEINKQRQLLAKNKGKLNDS